MCIPNRGDPSRPLFFVIDWVHILKCTRNNWLNQSNDRRVFYFPEFQAESTRERHMLSASFPTIREAYKLVCDQLLRYGHSLSRKALCPSNIERQNVKLALQIFNDSLPPALRSIRVKHNLLKFEGTASFIEITVKWWKIVNVKTPNKGRRVKDDFQNPVFSLDDDPKVDFLYELLDWLDLWKSKNLSTGVLTRDTHRAFRQTTRALLEVVRYCFEELGLNYVLLGKIQTDGLQDRFGK